MLGWFLHQPAPAQQFPSQQRGLSADTSFQVGGIDHVNLFNGSLTQLIQLGTPYPVGPNLSFSLSLSYSSNGWDYEQQACFDPSEERIVFYGVPYESPHTNAGFGWRITPGKIFAPVPLGARYITPDGSERTFYTELHPGHPAAGAQPDTWFSNDSSYQRMRYYAAGSGVCTAATGGSSDCYQIEFADGTIHEFHDFGTGTAEEPEWLVTRMMDRFEADQFIAFDYSTANEWRISDSHGRSHKVIFSGGRVSRVELAAFGGTTATWTFTHTSTAIERQNFHPPSCDARSNTLTVPLLTRLTLPDGSFYEMAYETSDFLTQSGAINSLRLRTGGEFKWSYQGIDFLSQDPEVNGPEHARTAYGVARKEIFEEAGVAASKEGEWTYSYTTVANPSMPGEAGMVVPCFHTTEVTDPLGNATVHYFDTAATNNWQYGLPFRRCNSDGTLASSPYLSQEIYEGSVATGTKLRSIFVEYDSDGRDGGSQQEKNHRLRLQRVEYHDDGDRFRQTVFSDFDGLGHYREMTTTGDFASGGDARTVVISFNPGSGTLLLNPDDSSALPGNDFVIPARDAPWVLETFTSRDVTEGGDTATTEFCFDADTGFLERQRTLAGSSRQATDLLTVFTEETESSLGTGRVAKESFYGGDSGGLATGALCTLSLPVQAEREIEHTYASGTLESSDFVDPCDGSQVLSIADFTIDANTALIATSRDSAGVATAFTYDGLGRQTGDRPPSSAWTIWDYDMPTAGNPSQVPRVTVTQCPSGQTTCTPLSWQRASFDGLGRKFSEEREYPDTTGVNRAERRFTYNALGWMTGQSVWDDTGEVTDFDHDRFGRVTTITPPDPSLARSLVRYRGEQRIERTSKVATGTGGTETWVCQREEHDAFGRLISVAENLTSTSNGVCSTAAGQVTTYAYDEADRLTRVCSGASGASCVQERRFTYDNRGFLTSEQHPEIGASGGGSLNYSYDASGNLLSQDVSGSNDFSLRYRYDPASRLTSVSEVVTTSPETVRPLKEFFYARSNSGSDKRAGKLVLSKRTNWVDPVSPLPSLTGTLPIVISQAIRYEGRDGRISERQTRYNFGVGHYAFTAGFSWTPRGNLDQVTYPRCLHDGCVDNDPARTVSYTYQRGFLHTVPGFLTDQSYQLGGMLHEVAHSNGVTDTFSVDPTHPRDRPHRITTSGVLNNASWDSGVYQYDGAGNVKAVGTQTYRYDRMSRLTQGQVEVGGVLRTQSTSYDAYGNVLSLTTNGSTVSTPVASATNRLTGGTYDAGGNLTAITVGGVTSQYTYDPLNTMKFLQSTDDQARVFIYDADDERILTFDCALVQCETQEARVTVTIRGLDNQVLRVYSLPFDGKWSWDRDYIYRGGQMLAAVEPDGTGEKTLHFHLDHLGTPRQVTDTSAQQVAFHSYYPFGGEATDPSQDALQLKFTGHERDPNGGTAGLLDYMHARYYSPQLARFLSVDPARRGSSVADPQSWNRYVYSGNDPMNLVDPDGEAALLATGLAGGGIDAGITIGLNLLGGRSAFEGVGESFVQGFALGATGLGLFKIADKGIKTFKAIQLSRKLARVRAVGQAGEDAVRAVFDIGRKRKIDVPGTTRARIPDGVTKFAINEVKNVKSLSLTQQIRDLIRISKAQNKKLVLFVRQDTKLSGPLLKTINTDKKIFLAFIPGT